VLARFILWRLVELAAAALAFVVIAWLLDGGLGRLLRGAGHSAPWHELARTGGDAAGRAARLAAGLAGFPALLVLAGALAAVALILALRLHARSRRRYTRLEVEAYRIDEASPEVIVAMYESLHKRVLRRWWRRLLAGQPSLSLELHSESAASSARRMWFAVSCPVGAEREIESALRVAYPNCTLRAASSAPGPPPALVRLKKHGELIKRASRLDRYEHAIEPPVNRLMRAMFACGGCAYVQVALTPAPTALERLAKAAYKHHERRVTWHHEQGRRVRDRSLYDEVELKGGLEVQHAPLFFADVRVVAEKLRDAEGIAAELRAHRAENRLVQRRTLVRQRLFGVYDRRVARGEGTPLPGLLKGVFSAAELAALWHLPSIDHAAVPFARGALPLAPAPPTVCRPAAGGGLLEDAIGPVTIHEACRRQNTAVPGAVEQGKTSLLVASVAEDLRRERCAVIVLDPKGDAADAALSVVPPERTCTLLDFASPTCGFNPLAVDAPPDVVADYVVGALRNLFTEADIRASSDRYLRNAIIAALAHDRKATLWDAARLLSVGQEGYAYRAHVGSRVRAMPELKEISEFFSSELAAQLEDARGPTTAKLDAPANKLARLLNSASIKRILLNDYLAVDLDRVIAHGEALIVKGALGTMGASNTGTLMQMIVGMIDAALARQQDRVPPGERVSVALKIDEAPLVINRGFAETLALKRSAGLETMACWQTDSQWVDREIRDQLDALFANRVYFATASVRDARSAASLMMAEYSDSVRPGVRNLSALGRPDARLHLPRHCAIASLVTPAGRLSPFLARTIPMRVDPERIAYHLARQAERGGRYLEDLRQPHWDAPGTPSPPQAAPPQAAPPQAAPPQAAPPQAAPPQAAPPQAPPVPGRTPGSPVTRPAERSPRSQAPSSQRTRATQAAGPPRSYRELVDLDVAHSLRVMPVPAAPRSLEPDALDLEMLALAGTFRFVLASQLHRRFNGDRALTTTQRRLKRLAEAALVVRLQFHRRDGAGVPVCYAITDRGLGVLRDAGRADADLRCPSLPSSFADTRAVAQVRHDVHVAAWVLAFEAALGGSRLGVRGPAEAAIVVPSGAASPEQLTRRLPGGRIAHEFRRTVAEGVRVDVERFETVRPDAAVALPEAAGALPEAAGALPEAGFGRAVGDPAATDQRGVAPAELLVELDDRLPTGMGARKLERYDHLVSGWATQTRRYRGTGAPPAVVFVCRDRQRARECARCADAVLLACQAYPGEHPWEWLYPGRALIAFAAERDVHEGSLLAYGTPPLPPEVRMRLDESRRSAAGGREAGTHRRGQAVVDGSAGTEGSGTSPGEPELRALVPGERGRPSPAARQA
jgi:hypothetical protein